MKLMKRNTFHLVMPLLFVLFAASCTKKGDTGPAGPAGPPGTSVYKGIVDGHVIVYDQYGSKKTSGLDGVQVTLKGVSTVVTDASGYFVFNNVSTGDYTITASGAGLGGTTVYNVPFLKDSIYTDVKMSQIPAFNLSTFTAYHNTGSQYDSLVMTFPGDARVRNCIVFVNKTSNAGNMPGDYLLTYVKALPANTWSTTVVLRIPVADLNSLNLYFGDKVYYGAASYVVNDASLYEDHSSTQNVYSAVGTVLVDSTVCP